jgi:hypothetical protein
MRRRRRKSTAVAKPIKRRRIRRKNMSDKITSNLMPLGVAAATATAAAVLSNKFDIMPDNVKLNAGLKIAAGLVAGAYFASMGNAPVGFGMACGFAAANIGQVVPQLANGTMADGSMATWAKTYVGDAPNARYLDNGGNVMVKRNGPMGFGLYYENGAFAPAAIQNAKFA